MNVLQQNLGVVRGLKPELLWRYFAELCTIPRESKHEAAAAHFVSMLADANLFKVDRFVVDEKNNVVVYMSATPGFEDRPSVCLQGHLDMVCEKLKESTHNFATDPIEFVMKDGKLMANGTTLGADNGIGAAALIAIMMSDGIEHGPLELLFTTEEETGFDGAAALGPEMIKSRLIINLDSEEEGEIFVGCAGGGRANGTINLAYVPSADDVQKCLITIKNLKGGHSGLEIHLGRANAIKLLGQVLQELTEFGAQVAGLAGGNKMNAIPRESEATVFIPTGQLGGATTAFNMLVEEIRRKYQDLEPDLTITLEHLGPGSGDLVFDQHDQEAVLELIESLPHGVIRMDPNNDELVETSNNVGIIATNGDKLLITCMFRSSVESQMDEVQSTISGMIEKSGGVLEIVNRYPAWEPRFDTPLLGTAKQVYQQLYGVEPRVKTIHAGLECAVFYRMFPGAEIISFGPTMHLVHTPDEHVEVDTVEKFWNYLLALLRSIGAPVAQEA